MNAKFLGKTQLSDVNNLYNYCPYCVKDAHKNGKNYKDVLKPIFIYRIMDSYKLPDGSFKNVPDSYYFCERCQRKLTAETYRLFYCAKPDGTPYSDKRSE